MQVRGVLDKIEETKDISPKFKRRNFIVVCQNHPDRFEHLKFELHQSRCDLLNDFSIGDKIIVTFQIQGNKWTSEEGKIKYYTTLTTWKIEKDTNFNSL